MNNDNQNNPDPACKAAVALNFSLSGLHLRGRAVEAVKALCEDSARREDELWKSIQTKDKIIADLRASLAKASSPVSPTIPPPVSVSYDDAVAILRLFYKCGLRDVTVELPVYLAYVQGTQSLTKLTSGIPVPGLPNPSSLYSSPFRPAVRFKDMRVHSREVAAGYGPVIVAVTTGQPVVAALGSPSLEQSARTAVSNAEYHAHTPWCKARSCGGLNPELCDCARCAIPAPQTF